MRISSMCSSTWVAPVLLALSWGVCAGQTPTLSGSWHLNVEKSSWGTATKPFSVELVVDHREPAIEYHGTVTYTNEETRAFGFAGAIDGKPYKMSRSFGDGEITLRRVDGLTVDSVFRTGDGQYTETARTSISRDGKLLTRKMTVQAPDGKKSWTELYEKR